MSISWIASKTVVTPIRGDKIEFNRNYEFNEPFIRFSFKCIEDALTSHYGQKTVLTTTFKHFLRQNEDDLIRLRNWARLLMS